MAQATRWPAAMERSTARRAATVRGDGAHRSAFEGSSTVDVAGALDVALSGAPMAGSVPGRLCVVHVRLALRVRALSCGARPRAVCVGMRPDLIAVVLHARAASLPVRHRPQLQRRVAWKSVHPIRHVASRPQGRQGSLIF